MNFNELISKGYKEFPPPPITYSVRACQKRIKDSDGNTLYFLSVYQFNYDGINRYEVHIQLYQKGTHNPLELNFFNGWTIENVENYANLIYYMGVKEYFEPYETINNSGDE